MPGMKVRHVLQYYGQVISRGVTDTWQAAGFWTLLAVPFYFVIGWGIHSYLHRFPTWANALGEPMAEWWINVVYVVIPLGVLALMTAVFKTLMAPVRMHLEQEKALKQSQTAQFRSDR
jgi:hypothetical protein